MITREKMLELLEKHKNLTLVGKELGISRTSVRVWCKKLVIKYKDFIYINWDNYLNRTYDKLLVTGYDKTHFVCKCLNCNTEDVRIFKQYISNKSSAKSCQKCNVGRTGNKNPYWNGHKLLNGHQFSRYRSGAKKRNIEFNLTIEDVWNMYEKSHYCPILEEKFVFESLNPKTISATNMSLDRINNNKGYSLDNVLLTHKDFNKFHYTYDLDYVLEISRLISNPKTERQNKCIITIPKWYLAQVKRGVILRPKLEYQVSDKDLIEQFNKQGGLCFYTGLKLDFGLTQTKRNLQTASLDRIDSSKNYTIDNICWCHKDVNMMKNNLTLDRFYHIAKMVCKNLQCLIK